MQIMRVWLPRGGFLGRAVLLVGLVDLGAASAGSVCVPRELSVVSPGEAVQIRLQLTSEGALRCSVLYRGCEVMGTSALGLRFKNMPPLSGPFRIACVERSTHAATNRPTFGARRSFPDRFSQAVVSLKERRDPFRTLRLVLRAYDEAAAFRYVIPEQEAIARFSITGELTAFSFPSALRAYAQYGNEGRYMLSPLARIRKRCELPLLLVDETRALYHLLHQADLWDYARAYVRWEPASGGRLKWILAGSVTGRPPFSTPWHVFRSAERPGRLLETNYIMYNLARPPVIEETSWIRPGKAMRVLPVTTERAKAVIDFAAANGLQYAELDAGWYGNERDPAADATTYRPEANVPEIARYGKEKGVGLLLYVNRIHLERQIDDILPLYRRWGVKGLKFGFVDGRSQKGIRLVHDWVEKAARYRMIVDIHDNYRPTGVSRTLPNLLTQEGIRGNEHMPESRHNAVLPFTRFVVGAADYTFCYLHPRLKTTSAHQLALSVIFFSPLQFVYWYGRPDWYKACRGKEFFKVLPTTWDQTKVVIDQVGKCVAVARKKGTRWFLGVITNQERRRVAVPLSFLGSGDYEAVVFRDDPAGEVSVSKKKVNAKETLLETLLPNGGAAAFFEKE